MNDFDDLPGFITSNLDIDEDNRTVIKELALEHIIAEADDSKHLVVVNNQSGKKITAIRFDMKSFFESALSIIACSVEQSIVSFAAVPLNIYKFIKETRADFERNEVMILSCLAISKAYSDNPEDISELERRLSKHDVDSEGISEGLISLKDKGLVSRKGNTVMLSERVVFHTRHKSCKT